MTKITQFSFTAGEVAPDLYARTDVNKYGIALATLKNGFVRVTGGISNRAGLEFCGEVKDSSKIVRLFPFRFNQSQQYVIEAGEGYFRYIQDGGDVIDSNSHVVETATSFTSAELFKLRYAQTADVLTFCSQARLPQELSRISNTDWEISDIAIEPTIDAPANVTAVHTGSTYASTESLTYMITAIKADTYEESLASDVTVGVTASILAGWMANEYVTLNWSAVDNATEYYVYKSVNGVYAYAGKTESTTFMDTGIKADLTTCVPIFKNPFDPSIVPDMTSNILPSGYTVTASTENASNKGFNAFDGKDSTLWQATAATGTIQATQTDAKTATLVKVKTGDNPPSAFNFYGSNDAGTTKTPLYTSSAVLAANTEYTFVFTTTGSYKTYGSGITGLVSGSYAQWRKLDFQEQSNNPATLNYFQQRSVYANTLNKPTSIFSSQSTLFRKFDIQRPLIATNGLTVKLDEREVNEIKHIVAMNDLILFTSDSEWRMNGSDGVFQATPPPVAKRQSSWGSSDLMPITCGNMVLFVQAGQSIVRDLGYTFASDSYAGDELSYLANHLFESCQIVDWAYSKEPHRIVWCVMSDGTLNALTYNKEQQILGWHHHETDGKFESVIVVREGYEDVPYFIVQRTINGVVKRYRERMKSRNVLDAKDGFFVDCGLTQTFSTPVNTISGLDHLEGKEVVILADGGVYEGKVVTNGSVSLGSSQNIDLKATKITVGLPYEFELKTMNIEGDNTQGSSKTLERFSVKLDKSREEFIVVGSDGTEQPISERSLESINDSGYLSSGDKMCFPNSDPSTEICAHIKQTKPLPITVLSITSFVNVHE